MKDVIDVVDEIEAKLVREAFKEGVKKAHSDAKTYLDTDAELQERVRAGIELFRVTFALAGLISEEMKKRIIERG